MTADPGHLPAATCGSRSSASACAPASPATPTVPARAAASRSSVTRPSGAARTPPSASTAYASSSRSTSCSRPTCARSVDAVLVLTPDHAHAEHAVRTPGGRHTDVRREAARHERRRRRPHPRGRAPHGHAPLRRAQHAAHAGGPGDARRHRGAARSARSRRSGAGTSSRRGGDYYFKDWHADRRNTTGLLLQKGAHDIDVIHWLAGAYTRRVSAVGRPRGLRRRHRPPRQLRPADGRLVLPRQLAAHRAARAQPGRRRRGHLDGATSCSRAACSPSYQQCHFTPDYWRNYTVIGTKGRLENFGDGPGALVKVWTRRTDTYRDDADEVIEIPAADTTGPRRRRPAAHRRVRPVRPATAARR